jgi:outer membrane protein assembly factor BamA
MFWRLYHARAFIPVLCALLLSGVLAQTDAPPVPSAGIRNVKFERTSVLSRDDQRQITEALQQEDSTWMARQPLDTLAKFIKNTVLTFYQDRGYWRAKLSANVTWVKGKDRLRQLDVLVTATNEGPRYSLKEIRLVGITVFPADQLLGLVPIHPRDLMSRTRVEQGLEAMRELYTAHGYIAFSAIPHAELDDASRTVLLDITVQEDKPFRFGSLATEGLDPATSRELGQAWDQVRNQFYSADKLRNLLRKSLALPVGADPLDYSTSNLDFDTHTVDVLVSSPPATQAEKTGR